MEPCITMYAYNSTLRRPRQWDHESQAKVRSHLKKTIIIMKVIFIKEPLSSQCLLRDFSQFSLWHQVPVSVRLLRDPCHAHDGGWTLWSTGCDYLWAWYLGKQTPHTSVKQNKTFAYLPFITPKMTISSLFLLTNQANFSRKRKLKLKMKLCGFPWHAFKSIQRRAVRDVLSFQTEGNRLPLLTRGWDIAANSLHLFYSCFLSLGDLRRKMA